MRHPVYKIFIAKNFPNKYTILRVRGFKQEIDIQFLYEFDRFIPKAIFNGIFFSRNCDKIKIEIVFDPLF